MTTVLDEDLAACRALSDQELLDEFAESYWNTKESVVDTNAPDDGNAQMYRAARAVLLERLRGAPR